MDGKPVSGASGRRQGRKRKAARRPRGLAIVERDGHWHIHGTHKVAGVSVRVRRSTGLPARKDTWDQADEERDRVKERINARIVKGQTLGVAVSVAARAYLKAPRERPLGATAVNVVKEIAARLGTRAIDEIAEGEWNDWVNDRHAASAPQTRERFLNGVVAFLNWCARKPRKYIDAVPAFDRDKKARNPNRRARRRVHDLRSELLALMIEEASPHLRGQLAAEWSTGARVSSVLFGCRVCDLILAPDREQLTFHDTKNGQPVVAALHPWAADRLREYVEWRGDLHDREAPLFLTHKRLPYSDLGKGVFGTQNKAAFNGMKRRAARRIRREAAHAARQARAGGARGEAWEEIERGKADAALVASVTQHWFRHLLATVMVANGGLRAAMEQGGWLDPRSVMGYTHDVPEARRRAVSERSAPGDSPGEDAGAGTAPHRNGRA